ncbi:hypothetical protein EDC01DRAFT_783076 [Geopyxis carbonaria]|nr:hypothetical protein EDC01DRAFT_783076 [Geopyxis carbonaria]
MDQPRNVCFNCGEKNHISTMCRNPPLPFAEQQKLRDNWARNRQNPRTGFQRTGSNNVPLGAHRGMTPQVSVNRAAVEESEFDEVEVDAHIEMQEEAGIRMAQVTEDSSSSEGDEDLVAPAGIWPGNELGEFAVRVNEDIGTGMKRPRMESEADQVGDQERVRTLGRNNPGESARVPMGDGESARDPTRESARDPTRESARDPTRESARDPMRESARGPMGDGESARDPTRESARDPMRESARGPMGDGESARDPTRESARVPMRESARDPMRDGEPARSREGEGETDREERRADRRRRTKKGKEAEEILKNRPRPKTLEKVQGMLNHEPFDFHKWLTTTRIDMTVLQYLQESPSARRALGWEMSLANPGKRSRKRKSSGLFDIRHCDIQDLRPNSHFGSFYVTISVIKGRTKYLFNKVVLDPGSDLNLITPDSANSLNLDLISTKSTTMTGVAMRTADGARHRLKHLVDLEFCMEGGYWRQEFFLLPKSDECGFSLLLGLPWLYDAWAKFDIRNFVYTIQTNNGNLIRLQGKPYKPRKYLAMEYPVQVERRRAHGDAGPLKEKYIYDESPRNLNYIGGGSTDDCTPGLSELDTTDESDLEHQIRILQLAEVLGGSDAQTELLGRIPYLDPVRYMENYGDFGASSEEANEWIRQAGGPGPARDAKGAMQHHAQRLQVARSLVEGDWNADDEDSDTGMPRRKPGMTESIAGTPNEDVLNCNYLGASAGDERDQGGGGRGEEAHIEEYGSQEKLLGNEDPDAGGTPVIQDGRQQDTEPPSGEEGCTGEPVTKETTVSRPDGYSWGQESGRGRQGVTRTRTEGTRRTGTPEMVLIRMDEVFISEQSSPGSGPRYIQENGTFEVRQVGAEKRTRPPIGKGPKIKPNFDMPEDPLLPMEFPTERRIHRREIPHPDDPGVPNEDDLEKWAQTVGLTIQTD